MKLLLTSGGLSYEIKNDFIKLLPQKPEYCRVVFIPTAANPEEDRWYLNKSKLRFAELGINMVSDVDIENETKDTLAPKLANADIIYVEGGNTFYLLKYVRASGFDSLVKDFLERGGVYVGSSAGSIIAGPTIETSNWKYADKNDVGLKELGGMELVPFAIAPHIDETNINETKAEAAKVGYAVAALNDHQAVVVDDARIEVVGAGDIIVFNHPLKEYLPQVIRDVGFDFDWDEKKVWQLGLPVSEIGIDQLVWHFDVPFYTDSETGRKYGLNPREIIDDPVRYVKEYERTMAADLSYPLDIMENKGRLLLLDGLHRLIKAYINGQKTVKVRTVPRSKILEIID